MEPYWSKSFGTIYHGDAIDVLRELPDGSVNCVVTSPPYWSLRDYGTEPLVWGGDAGCRHEWGKTERLGTRNRHNDAEFDRPCRENTELLNPQSGQFCQKCNAWRGNLGLEPTPELYIEHMTQIFSEVKRVLKKNGNCWINLGDSYASGKGSCYNPGGGSASLGKSRKNHAAHPLHRGNKSILAKSGLKPKDMVGIPWRLAFALQADGWWLRQDIIWSKPNPMPESVKDRCTKSHEYIFLLTKSDKYYFDSDAIKEIASYPNGPNNPQLIKSPYGQGYARNKSWKGSRFDKGKTFKHQLERCQTGPRVHSNIPGRSDGGAACNKPGQEFRNKRSVWTISTQPFSGAHFAVFPEAMVKPCILAGCPKDGIVLDPFFGSGTVGVVAYKNDRRFIGIELSKEYLDEIAIPRIEKETRQRKLF